MPEQSTQTPSQGVNWVAGLSTIGGIATGVVALIRSMNEDATTAAAFLAVAALAFGLIAIAVLRK